MIIDKYGSNKVRECQGREMKVFPTFWKPLVAQVRNKSEPRTKMEKIQD